MRNIEPPFGRGSATKFFDTFANFGAIAEMKSLIGACTESRKRCLFSSNQGRSLCAFSSRKKAKKSFGNPLNSAMEPSFIRKKKIHHRATEKKEGTEKKGVARECAQKSFSPLLLRVLRAPCSPCPPCRIFFLFGPLETEQRIEREIAALDGFRGRDLENAVGAQHGLAVRRHQPLREQQIARHLERIGAALDPGIERRRRQIIAREID